LARADPLETNSGHAELASGLRRLTKNTNGKGRPATARTWSSSYSPRSC